MSWSDELQAQFEASDLEQAESLLAAGAVSQVKVKPKGDGKIITGSVAVGDANFRTFITIRNGVIDGECNCRKGENCAHVAAVLMAANQFDSADISNNPAYLHDVAKTSATESNPETNTSDSEENQPQDDRLEFVLLKQDDSPIFSALRIELVTGEEGERKPYTWYEDTVRGLFPRFVSDDDQEVFSLLKSQGYQPDDNNLVHLDKPLSKSLFDILLQSNRLVILDNAACHHPLVQGEVQPLELQWQIDTQATQSLEFINLENQHAFNGIIPCQPLQALYLEVARGRKKKHHPFLVGQVTSNEVNLDWAPLIHLPKVTITELPEFISQWTERLQAQGIPLPTHYEVETKASEDLIPSLKLYSQRSRGNLRLNNELKPLYIDAAKLTFNYGEKSWDVHNPLLEKKQQVIGHRYCTRKKKVSCLVRNYEKEELLANSLEGFLPLQDIYDEDLVTEFPISEMGMESQKDWEAFVLQQVGALKQEGWEIDFDSSFRYRLARSSTWQVHIKEVQGRHLGVWVRANVDGEEIEILPLLQEVISQYGHLLKQILKSQADEQVLLPLPDGRKLLAPGQRLKKILLILLDLFDEKTVLKEDGLNLDKGQLFRIAQFIQLGEELSARDDAFKMICEASLYERFEEVVAVNHQEFNQVPQGLQVTPRDYQKYGLGWLQFVGQLGGGGILADDMGLGKTLQCLSHLLLEKELGRLTKPALIVVPTSLIGNWLKEVAKFTPELKALKLYGSNREALYENIAEYDLVITSYALIIRDYELLAKEHFSYLVLDEAQQIKNPRAKVTQLIKRLVSDHRICMTGTPIENHLGELWSQFDFLMPTYLGDEKQFKKLYQNPIERQRDDFRMESLLHRISPFILRRVKEEVAKELPAKTEIVRNIVLEGEQATLYEAVRVTLQKEIAEQLQDVGIAKQQIQILDALLKLRQICCDPRLLKDVQQHSATESAKLNYLMGMLEDLMEEGRKVLVFSQFTSMLSLIEKEIQERSYRYVKLTGNTRNREEVVESFQSGEADIFLISLKAGGVGLNLTAADTVVHYDPWWNPAAEDQATDRAHRIGQDKPVFVYRLVVEGSVEERIRVLQERKKHLADSLIRSQNDVGGSFSIEEEDIKHLFAPLA